MTLELGRVQVYRFFLVYRYVFISHVFGFSSEPVVSVSSRQNSFVSWLRVALLSLFWGSAFTAIKLGLGDMSWLTLTLLRLVVACCGFGLYFAIARRSFRSIALRDLPGMAVLGFTGFTGYHVFLNFGERFTTAGTASLVIAITPALIALLAAGFLKERLTSARIGGIVLAFLGLGVMLLLMERGGGEWSVSLSVGGALIAPSAALSAMYSVIGKPYLQRYPPLVVVFYALLFGTLFTLPLVFANLSQLASETLALPPAGWFAVLFLGVFPTFVGYGLWYQILETMEVSAAGAYLYLTTLVAVVSGILLLQESLTAPLLVGGLMVMFGVYAAQRR